MREDKIIASGVDVGEKKACKWLVVDIGPPHTTCLRFRQSTPPIKSGAQLSHKTRQDKTWSNVVESIVEQIVYCLVKRNVDSG